MDHKACWEHARPTLSGEPTHVRFCPSSPDQKQESDLYSRTPNFCA